MEVTAYSPSLVSNAVQVAAGLALPFVVFFVDANKAFPIVFGVLLMAILLGGFLHGSRLTCCGGAVTIQGVLLWSIKTPNIKVYSKRDIVDVAVVDDAVGTDVARVSFIDGTDFVCWRRDPGSFRKKFLECLAVD